MYFDAAACCLASPNVRGAAGVIVAGDDEQLLVSVLADLCEQQLRLILRRCGLIWQSAKEFAIVTMLLSPVDGKITFTLAVETGGSAYQCDGRDASANQVSALGDAASMKVTGEDNDRIAAVGSRFLGLDKDSSQGGKPPVRSGESKAYAEDGCPNKASAIGRFQFSSRLLESRCPTVLRRCSIRSISSSSSGRTTRYFAAGSLVAVLDAVDERRSRVVGRISPQNCR